MARLGGESIRGWSIHPTSIQAEIAMSWNELERLVDDAEADAVMRRALRHCRSRRELLLAAGRLGYAITNADLQQAWMLQCHAPAHAPACLREAS
jgi:hypothetical protein